MPSIDQAVTLETRPCGRCGGSGRHSFNQTSGSRCFDCHGKRMVLTARGKAAAAFLAELRSVLARDLVVGDHVSHDVVAPGVIGTACSTVVEMRPSTLRSVVAGESRPVDMIDVVCTGKGGRTTLTVSPDRLMRKIFDPAIKAEQFARAIAYQATLDANGRPARVAA